MIIKNFLSRVSFLSRCCQRFGSDNKSEGGNHGIRIDEQSIKRKIKQIKQRQGKTPANSQSLLKNYKINKIKPEVTRFREQTDSQNLMRIEDISLDEKPTALQINSFNEQMIEVDQFAYPPSVILTPNQILIWELTHIKQLTISHLKLAELINPPPTYIILGCRNSNEVPVQVRQYLKNLGVNYDILDMFEAVSNYNTYSNDEVPLIAFLNSS